MSAEHDASRRSLARIAGLILMVWGILFAVASALGALVVAGAALVTAASSEGPSGTLYLTAVGAVVGGLLLAGLGAGKAMAGWILVKKDQEL